MTERIIRFNDVYICTESFGDTNDPTILLIMGATSSMIWWEEDFCRKLSNQGFHVIRYDNRDVGRSITYEYGHPEYTFEDLADDAIQVLDAYRVDKAHIVGMSMGGIITQIVALKHP
ncbi:TPA: alpha/beta hydrolase, partial [Escherichia coli]|nr:alpha/beta hydrolase [Escherichia coli]